MKQADMPAMPVGEQVDTMHLKSSCNGLTKLQHAELEILKSLCINKRESQKQHRLVEEAKQLAGLLIESWESENE